jgi:UDP-glucose 4-epimerase
MSTCLVTGGAGFIGSHVVEGLLAAGQTVRVLDNLSTGKLDNLAGVRDRIELITADLTDCDVLQSALAGVEVVFHQAALASVSRSISDPLPTHRVCATGTLLLLIAAQRAGVRRFIYAGSSSAYGNACKLPVHEDDRTGPLSPYAVAKLTGELYCQVFTHIHGLETVRLRYFNVFGPRQDADSPYSAVIPRFIRALRKGESPVIYGDGLQSRDFTCVGDVVRANLLAAGAPGVAGKVFNISCGRSHSLLDLLRYANELLGTRIEPVFEPPRAGDVRHSLADTTRAQAELGYRPSTDLKNDLRRCLDQ